MVAKKKTTTKKKAKSKKKKTASRATRRLTFRCRGGCIATPAELHVDVGDTVLMTAVGTDVEVRFANSPFKRRIFNIPSGGTDSAVVIKTTGTFRYRLKCDECPTPALPPRIIID